MKNGICLVATASIWVFCISQPIPAETEGGPMLNAVYFCSPDGLSVEECAARFASLQVSRQR